MTSYAIEYLSNINFKINFEKKMLKGIKKTFNLFKKLFYHKIIINVSKI